MNLQAQTPTLVKDINPGPANGFPNNKEYLVALGNVVFFAADDGTHGSELWRSDGTSAGTYLVRDINPGNTGSLPIRFSVLGDQVLFIANDGTHGDELWATDGTESGTVLVKDINPGAGHAVRRNYIPQVRDRRVLKGFLYFAADTGTDYSQLWRSDGTEAGTTLVKDICPACDATNFATGEFTELHDTLYLSVSGSLWRSDGTPAGTQLIIGTLDPNGPGIIRFLTGVQDRLYMAGGHDAFNLDLWVSDGTAGGTKMLKDLPGTGTPHQFTLVGNNVSFIANDNMWSTDGTEAGTQQISALKVDNAGFRRALLFLWNEEVYYRAKAADEQSYLYKTNGTPGEEEQVFTQNYQGTSFNDPLFVTTTNDFLFYDAVNEDPILPAIGRIGKTGAKELIPLPGSSLAEYLFVAGDNLFFRSNSSAAGQELWKLPLTTIPTTEPGKELRLRLYPTFSPEGIFYLDIAEQPATNYRIAVFDALGKLAYQGLQTSGELRLSALSGGVYVVQVTGEDGRQVARKIIIGQ